MSAPMASCAMRRETARELVDRSVGGAGHASMGEDGRRDGDGMETGRRRDGTETDREGTETSVRCVLRKLGRDKDGIKL